jgi:hypothetical protein
MEEFSELAEELGRGTNFAWQNSGAVVPNRLIAVKYLFRYERLKGAEFGKVASAK